MSIGVVVTKNDIFSFFTKITCSRRTSQQLLIALLLIAQASYGAASCLAACWAGVSQPSSLSLNKAVSAQRAATACLSYWTTEVRARKMHVVG